MKPMRVMIVEDSDVVRELLCHVIEQDPRLTVVSAVDSGEKAVQILNRVVPDVISMDIRLPGMNGFEATKRIMSERPTPIVVVSASVEKEDLRVSINALKAGALSIVEKPTGTTHADYEAMAERICTQLAIMSQVHLVRQKERRLEATLSKKTMGAEKKITADSFKMLGIVTSTGGPKALNDLLLTLPHPFPLPILLVQHITPAFLDGFVSWLEATTKFPSSLAEEGITPEANHIYVAPANRHLGVKKGRLTLLDTPPIHSHKPSGTILFESMANDLKGHTLGILLTGMGEDGAQGLLALRESGGYTISEDESTAVVYGMPKAAREIGAVCENLPLHEIGPRVVELMEKKR